MGGGGAFTISFGNNIKLWREGRNIMSGEEYNFEEKKRKAEAISSSLEYLSGLEEYQVGKRGSRRKAWGKKKKMGRISSLRKHPRILVKRSRNILFLMLCTLLLDDDVGPWLPSHHLHHLDVVSSDIQHLWQEFYIGVYEVPQFTFKRVKEIFYIIALKLKKVCKYIRRAKKWKNKDNNLSF